MRFFAIALTILAFCAAAYAQESVDPNSKDTVVVADQRYWWEKEGNLGVSITAKFNSTEQMAQTLYLLKEVGTFHSEKWMLQKILVVLMRLWFQLMIMKLLILPRDLGLKCHFCVLIRTLLIQQLRKMFCVKLLKNMKS